MTQIKVRLEGYYRLQTSLEDGTITKDTGPFHNLITNQGMDRFGSITSGASLFNTVSVGTGNTTPAFTDTSLVTFVAGVASSNLSSATYVAAAGTQPAYWTRTYTYVYGVGAAAGNLAEIGTGTANNSLSSRALIVDNSGVPTTITVLPTEILTCTYEFRVYIDVADQTGSYLISGVTYNVTWRPISISTAPGLVGGVQNSGAGSTPSLLSAETSTLVAVTGSMSGDTFNTNTVGTYTNGNFFIDCTVTSSIGSNNYATGIGMLLPICNFGQWQISHSPKIPKDNTKSISLVYRLSWARFTPPP